MNINYKIKYGAILEARMGSSRLPGKTLMDLYGEPLIKRVIDRINGSKKITKLVLATTLIADPLLAYCNPQLRSEAS